MRLIDADELKDRLKEYCVDGDSVVQNWYEIMGIDSCIDHAPTVDAEQAVVEWIPCSERLPEKDGWYLVTVQGYETVTDVSLYSADGSAWGDVSTKQKVTAWTPLPTPYGERKDK